MPELIAKIPAWAWYVLVAVAVGLALRRLTVEKGVARRGGDGPREKEWPEVAEGIIRIYRRDPAFADELGAPLALSRSGREILEESGLRAMVDARFSELQAVLKARGAETEEEVLRWGLASFFETDPGEEFKAVRDFIGFKAHYEGSKLDLQLIGVVAAVYIRDKYLGSQAGRKP